LVVGDDQHTKIWAKGMRNSAAVRALPDTVPVSIVEVPAASAEAPVSAPSAGQPAPASMT